MARTFDLQPRSGPPVETPYRRISTPLPAPESLPVLEDLRRAEPDAMRGEAPILWDRAEGCRVFDPHGNIWLDFSSGGSVAGTGHVPDAVRRAVTAEVERGCLHSHALPTGARARLVRTMVDIVPLYLDRVILLGTGSEAVELALKLARTRARTDGGDRKIVNVSFEGAFHGRTLGAQLAGGTPALKDWIGRPDPSFIQVPYPDGSRTPKTGFEGFLQAIGASGIEPRDIASVLVESCPLRAGGFAPAEYMKRLESWCRLHDAALIADETEVGIGRTGRLFAFEHDGIEPDMVLLGQGLSGSLPLAVVIGRSAYLDTYGPGELATVEGGNPVAAAAAAENLDLIRREDLVANAARMEGPLRSGLERLRSLFPGTIARIHGRGLAFAMHIVRPGTDLPDADLAFDIVDGAWRNGLLLLAPVGHGRATVRITPPLCIDEAMIRDGIDALEAALRRATDRRPEEGGSP